MSNLSGMRKRILLVVLLALWVLPSAAVLAWGPNSHYLIAKFACEGGSWENDSAGRSDVPPGVEDYASLPDFRDSREETWYKQQYVSPYFAWGHGVIDNGQGGPLYLAPVVPTYAPESRSAGWVMQKLLHDKLELQGKISAEVLRNLQNTVNGFRVHNAADRQVHFEYFLGIEQNTGQKPERWTVHHGLKERWADYVNLDVYAFGKDVSRDGIFKSENEWEDGSTILKTEQMLSGTIPPSGPGFKGNGALMALAQRVHRKNRWQIRESDPHFWLDPEDAESIQERIDGHEIPDEWKKRVWARWQYPEYVPEIPGVIDRNFIKDFEVNGEPISGDPPTNNKDEYYKLRKYAKYTKQRYDQDQQDDDDDDVGEWTVWDDNQRKDRFRESVTRAREKLYSTQQLTPTR
jgi:hypothetical protein